MSEDHRDGVPASAEEGLPGLPAPRDSGVRVRTGRVRHETLGTTAVVFTRRVARERGVVHCNALVGWAVLSRVRGARAGFCRRRGSETLTDFQCLVVHDKL